MNTTRQQPTRWAALDPALGCFVGFAVSVAFWCGFALAAAAWCRR